MKATLPTIATFPNPARGRPYSVTIESPDLTWIGRRDGTREQPDYGTLRLTYEPRLVIADLKSMKLWLEAIRSQLLSYERLATDLFDAFVADIQPRSLRIELACHPRGGAATTVVVEERAIRYDRRQP